MRLVMPEVYSFYFPETAAAARELRTDPAFDSWFDEAWLGREASLPTQFLEGWRRWSGVELSAFPHAVVGNGSSELIRELVSGPAVAVFEGEYEGYAAIAAARGIPVHRLSRGEIPALPPGTRMCISQPSARDGEYWSGLDAFLDQLDPTIRVLLDLTYVGLVRRLQPIRCDHTVVDTVIFSLSKPFGLYRYRVGGAFTRAPLPTFAYNHWFNNLLGLKLAVRLMEHHTLDELPRKYEPIQAELVRRLVEAGAVPPDTVPSNVLLLARSTLPSEELRYDRAPGVSRYCLTPGIHAVVHAR